MPGLLPSFGAVDTGTDTIMTFALLLADTWVEPGLHFDLRMYCYSFQLLRMVQTETVNLESGRLLNDMYER